MPGKRRHKRKGRKFLNTAQKALKVALMTKSLLNVELKHIDTAPTNLTADTVGGVVAMHGCSEGNRSSQRNGLSIKNKSLTMKYTVKINGSSVAPQTVVFYIVKDKQPRGTTPTWSDCFESVDQVSLMNNENTSRFRILKKVIVSLSPSGNEVYHGSFYKPLNFHTKYTGETAAATDIGYNGLYIFYMSDQATNKPTIRYSSRIRYVDN